MSRLQPLGLENGPKAYQGQYRGKEKCSTVVLEIIASHDLWIWHWFFGMPGSCNDINILDRSPLMTKLVKGEIANTYYVVNGKKRNQPYFLVDGIYPDYGCFVKTIEAPETEKKKYFAKRQEGIRKDVERAFGVLQARFNIIKTPSRFWDTETMGMVMKTCLILHNMIIECRRNPDEVDYVAEEFGQENVQAERVIQDELRNVNVPAQLWDH
jgi:hypothetical protein